MDEQKRRKVLIAGAAMIVVTACVGMALIMQQRRMMMMQACAICIYFQRKRMEDEIHDEMILRALKREREHECWSRPPESKHFCHEAPGRNKQALIPEISGSSR